MSLLIDYGSGDVAYTVTITPVGNQQRATIAGDGIWDGVELEILEQ